VDDSRNVSQDGQQNVDEKVCTTSSLKKDTNRWQDDGEDDFDNVASGERHIDEFAGECLDELCFLVWDVVKQTNNIIVKIIFAVIIPPLGVFP